MKQSKPLSELIAMQQGMLTPEQAAEIASEIRTPDYSAQQIEKPLREPSAEEIAYAAKVNAPRAVITKEKLTNEQVLEKIYIRAERWLLKQNKKLILDSSSINLFKTLVLYFNQDPKFETLGENFSLKKGLFLRGVPGLGKTFSLKMFAQDFSNADGFRGSSNFLIKNFVSTKTIEAEFAGGGYKTLLPYTKFKKNYFYEDQTENNNNVRACFVFDDLGVENTTVAHFKNEINVMENILMDRYEIFTDQNIKTHLTTNITDSEEIENLYGARVRSRLREMCNVIDLTGNDRRI